MRRWAILAQLTLAMVRMALPSTGSSSCVVGAQMVFFHRCCAARERRPAHHARAMATTRAARARRLCTSRLLTGVPSSASLLLCCEYLLCTNEPAPLARGASARLGISPECLPLLLCFSAVNICLCTNEQSRSCE